MTLCLPVALGPKLTVTISEGHLTGHCRRRVLETYSAYIPAYLCDAFGAKRCGYLQNSKTAGI